MKNQFLLYVLPHTLSPLDSGAYEVISYSFRYKPSHRKFLCLKIKIICDQERIVQIPFSKRIERQFHFLKRLFAKKQPVYVQFENFRICSYQFNASSGVTLYANDFSIRLD